MTLEERIRTDVIAARKGSEAFRVDTLRFLVAQIGNRAIEKRGTGTADPLTDTEVVEVLQKEAKKRREAAEVYARGGRADLAKKEEDELTILAAYLPAMMSREEVTAAVRRVAKSGGDFKAVMPKVMAELKGKADGKLVAEVVKEVLG